MLLPFQGDHWLPSFNFNVEEWFEAHRYETLAFCRTLALACDRGEARRPIHDPQQHAGG